MRTSLIITTYNRPDALNLVLQSVENQTTLPFEVIIADDGSTEETSFLIEEYKSRSNLNIIHSWQEDKGFRLARSRNKAILLSKSDYIIQIDGDMVLHKDFVSDHIKNAIKGFFIQGSRVLLNETVTKKALKDMTKKFIFFQTGLSNRKNAIHSNFLSKALSFTSIKITGIRGCNMSYFKSDFIKVNGFNNLIEGWGREDTEFVVRLFNLGIRRKNLKFSAIQYHLWHGLENNKSLKINDQILENTLTQKLIKCDSGVNELKNEH